MIATAILWSAGVMSIVMALTLIVEGILIHLEKRKDEGYERKE